DWQLHGCGVGVYVVYVFFFFSSRRRHTRFSRDWSSDVCSSDLTSDMLASLRDTHRFVQQNLKDEVFWAASMPCEIHGNDSIPIRSEERRVGKECRSGWWP